MLTNTKNKLASGDPITLVALGDSLTEGWMVNKGYLDYLGEMIHAKYPKSRVTIVNRGIPGDTAQGGLHRLSSDVLESDPDLVFIQFGLNDAFMGYAPEQFQKTIIEIIDRIQSDTYAEILILTSVAVMSPMLNQIAERFYEALASVAQEKGLPVAMVHEYWKKKIREGVLFTSLVQADQVHPTSKGYLLMAEAVMEML